MWASMVPSPKGTSVMIWFIFTAWAGAAVLPAYSSRIALAASIHSSDRNGYLSPRGGPPARCAVGGMRRAR